MKNIIIAGGGVSGTYFSRLLKREGIKFTLYDAHRKRGHSCAWGSHYSLLKEKFDKMGLDIDDYVLCRVKYLYLNGVKMELNDFVIIDKPRLLVDMRKGIKITYRKINCLKPCKKMVVNATGHPLEEDYHIPTYQEKVETFPLEKDTIYIHINLDKAGYSWAFPLNEEGSLFHAGAWCYKCHPLVLVDELYNRYEIKARTKLCLCRSDISFFKSYPIVGDVVSIGEAAGCVHPITGEGILPAMDTAEYLADSLRNNTFPLGYVERIEEMQDSYSNAWRAWKLMEKYPRLGWALVFSSGFKSAKKSEYT